MNRKQRILQFRRENPAWTLEQIADAVHTSKQYVHKVLSGAGLPTVAAPPEDAYRTTASVGRRIAELRAAAVLLRHGARVFQSVTGGSPYALVVAFPGVPLLRVGISVGAHHGDHNAPDGPDVPDLLAIVSSAGVVRFEPPLDELLRPRSH